MHSQIQKQAQTLYFIKNMKANNKFQTFYQLCDCVGGVMDIVADNGICLKTIFLLYMLHYLLQYDINI